MRVDSHVHVWPSGSVVGGDPSIAKAGQTESLVSAMFDAQVGAAVLVQPSTSGLDHSYLLKTIRSGGLMAVGIAQVDPEDASSAEVIARALANVEFVGFRLPLIRSDDAWLGRNGDAFWGIAAARKVVVSLLLAPVHLERVASMAVDYPSVPVVIDHLGRLDLSADPVSAVERLCSLASLPNVHVKASALSSLGRGKWPYRDVWPHLYAVIDSFGTERVMWGSDYPYVLLYASYSDSLLAVKQALAERYEPEEVDDITGGNALRLFFPGRMAAA